MGTIWQLILLQKINSKDMLVLRGTVIHFSVVCKSTALTNSKPYIVKWVTYHPYNKLVFYLKKWRSPHACTEQLSQ